MTTRTRTAALLLAGALALTLPACQPEDEPAQPPPTTTDDAPATTAAETFDPPDPTTTEADPPPLSAADTEALYVAVLRDTWPTPTAQFTDSELIGLGHDVCTTIDAGGVSAAYAIAAESSGGDPQVAEMLGGVVGASVAAFCPEYLGDL